MVWIVSWFWSKKTYFRFSNNSSKRIDLLIPISPERSQLDPTISKIKKGGIGLEKKNSVKTFEKIP
jgi:hypothetical protein